MAPANKRHAKGAHRRPSCLAFTNGRQPLPAWTPRPSHPPAPTRALTSTAPPAFTIVGMMVWRQGSALLLDLALLVGPAAGCYPPRLGGGGWAPSGAQAGPRAGDVVGATHRVVSAALVVVDHSGVDGEAAVLGWHTGRRRAGRKSPGGNVASVGVSALPLSIGMVGQSPCDWLPPHNTAPHPWGNENTLGEAQPGEFHEKSRNDVRNDDVGSTQSRPKNAKKFARQKHADVCKAAAGLHIRYGVHLKASM